MTAVSKEVLEAAKRLDKHINGDDQQYPEGGVRKEDDFMTLLNFVLSMENENGRNSC